MIFWKKNPPRVPRDFPLVLRPSWLAGIEKPREGRLRALAGRTGPRTPRPLSMAQKARQRRFALTFGLHRVPRDVAEEVAWLRSLRDRQALAAE